MCKGIATKTTEPLANGSTSPAGATLLAKKAILLSVHCLTVVIPKGSPPKVKARIFLLLFINVKNVIIVIDNDLIICTKSN